MKLLFYIRLAERSFLVTLFLAMVVLFFGNVIAREIGGTFASKFAWIEEAVNLAGGASQEIYYKEISAIPLIDLNNTSLV